MSSELRCQTCLVNQDVTLVFCTEVCQPVHLVCLSQLTTCLSVWSVSLQNLNHFQLFFCPPSSLLPRLLGKCRHFLIDSFQKTFSTLNLLIWMEVSCFSCLAHLLCQNRTSDILKAYRCPISCGFRFLNLKSFCLGANFKRREHKWTHKPNSTWFRGRIRATWLCSCAHCSACVYNCKMCSSGLN